MQYRYRNILLALTLTGVMAFTGCTATNNAARATRDLGGRVTRNVTADRYTRDGRTNARGTQVAGRVDGVNVLRGSGPRRTVFDTRYDGEVNPAGRYTARDLGNYNTPAYNRQGTATRNMTGGGNSGNARQAGQGQGQGQGQSQVQTGRAKSAGTLPGNAALRRQEPSAIARQGQATQSTASGNVNKNADSTRRTAAIKRVNTRAAGTRSTETKKAEVKKAETPKTQTAKRQTPQRSTTRKAAAKPAENKQAAARTTAPRPRTAVNRQTVNRAAQRPAAHRAAPHRTAPIQPRAAHLPYNTAHTQPRTAHMPYNTAGNRTADRHIANYSGNRARPYRSVNRGIRNHMELDMERGYMNNQGQGYSQRTRQNRNLNVSHPVRNSGTDVRRNSGVQRNMDLNRGNADRGRSINRDVNTINDSMRYNPGRSYNNPVTPNTANYNNVGGYNNDGIRNTDPTVNGTSAVQYNTAPQNPIPRNLPARGRSMNERLNVVDGPGNDVYIIDEAGNDYYKINNDGKVKPGGNSVIGNEKNRLSPASDEKNRLSPAAGEKNSLTAPTRNYLDGGNRSNSPIGGTAAPTVTPVPLPTQAPGTAAPGATAPNTPAPAAPAATPIRGNAPSANSGEVPVQPAPAPAPATPAPAKGR